MPRGGPYFGSTGGPIQVPDYSGIAEAARIRAGGQAAFGQGIGQGLSAIGQGIAKYRLNEQERAKIKGRLDRYLTPQKRTDLVSTGVEAVDKKRQSIFDKRDEGNASMKDLSYLDSLISTDIEMESQAAKQRASALDMLTKQQGLLLGKADLFAKNMENQFKEADQFNRIHKSNIDAMNNELAFELAQLEVERERATNPDVIKGIKQKIEEKQLTIDILRRNDLFDDKTFPDRVSAARSKARSAEAGAFREEHALETDIAKFEAGSPDFTTPGQAKKIRDEWKDLGMLTTFKPAEFGKGFVIDTIEGEVENVWTPVPEAPGYFLYGGAVLKLDELPSGEKKVTKLGTQQVSENARLRISVLGALKDPATQRYITVKRKTDTDARNEIIRTGEGTYEYTDAEGYDFKEEYDAAMEEKIKAIEAYEKYLGAPENLGDPLNLRQP